MKYVSVCSGIEAATVAWHPLGWTPLMFAEIAPFPSRVLAHHYPEVPNVGDFTAIPARSDCDLLVGGTPCQAFSVAGLREGLADSRGNLALEFMRLADRLRPRWLLWENVPGVLSSNGGRDFGSILGALAELGYGFAWRVLDAQFFGVPQRRRRVFLVGSLAGAAAAAAVLFERTSLRRDTPSRRKTREDVAGTLGGGSGRRGGAPDTDRMTFVPEVSGTLLTQDRRADAAAAWSGKLIAGREPWTLASGQANAPTLEGQAPTLEGQAPTLTCLHEAPIVAFDPTQITSPGNRSSARGDTSPTLAKSARPPHVAIGQAIVPGGRFTREAVEHLFDGEGRRVPLRGPPISVEHAGQILDANSRRAALAVALRGREGGATAELGGDQANALRAANGGGSAPYVLAPAIAFNARQDPVHSTTTTGALDTDATSQAVCVTGSVTHALTSVGSDASEDGTGRGTPIVNAPWRVRRLTPVECERLQGFPDDYTAIPGAADGPRYAALGNSMAVDVMRWIGARIDFVDAVLR